MPTCAVAEFMFSAKSWSNIGKAKLAKVALDYPKKKHRVSDEGDYRISLPDSRCLRREDGPSEMPAAALRVHRRVATPQMPELQFVFAAQTARAR